MGGRETWLDLVEFVEAHGDVGDPLFVVVGAAAMLVVLITLYRGGWRYVTSLVLFVLGLLLTIAMLTGLAVAVAKYHGAVFGPAESRANDLIWALIITAAEVVTLACVTNGRLGRFLDKLRVK
jgi:hypothetical protein